MKITRRQLRRIIKEELKRVITESYDNSPDNATQLKANIEQLSAWMPKAKARGYETSTGYREKASGAPSWAWTPIRCTSDDPKFKLGPDFLLRNNMRRPDGTGEDGVNCVYAIDTLERLVSKLESSSPQVQFVVNRIKRMHTSGQFDDKVRDHLLKFMTSGKKQGA